MKFYVQEQAPSGGYYDVLGTDSELRAQEFARYCSAQGRSARVVERTDVVLRYFEAE